jgi:hypothetical protein
MSAERIYDYRVVGSLCVSPDGDEYMGYGIAVRDGERELAVEDVFTSEERAESAAQTLNRCQVSLVHWMDVLEDMVTC